MRSTHAAVDPRMDGRREPASPAQRIGGKDALRAKLFAEIPELAEVRERIVRPLPFGDLAYGTFWSVSLETLRKCLLLAEWFRRQLSAEHPVCGETAADLGAGDRGGGRRLARSPKRSSEKSDGHLRAQVSRRAWHPALPFVKSARKRLAEVERVYPDVLNCEAWPPAPVIDFRNVHAEVAAAAAPRMTRAELQSAWREAMGTPAPFRRES